LQPIRGIRTLKERADEIPFDSSRKYMAVLTEDGTIYTKGAPERITEMCSHEAGDEKNVEIDRERLMAIEIEKYLMRRWKHE
jgi:magnesium-transporting ATPase (P-type)